MVRARAASWAGTGPAPLVLSARSGRERRQRRAPPDSGGLFIGRARPLPARWRRPAALDCGVGSDRTADPGPGVDSCEGRPWRPRLLARGTPRRPRLAAAPRTACTGHSVAARSHNRATRRLGDDRGRLGGSLPSARSSDRWQPWVARGDGTGNGLAKVLVLGLRDAVADSLGAKTAGGLKVGGASLHAGSYRLAVGPTGGACEGSGASGEGSAPGG